MKKRNIILLSLFSIISLGILLGMVYYSFELQKRKAIDDNINGVKENTEKIAISITPNPTVVSDKGNTEPNQDESTKNELETETQEDLVNSNPTPSIPIPIQPNLELDSKFSILEDLEDPNLITYPYLLAFGGDINFDENSKPMQRYDRENKGILGGISEDLLEEMKAAHIMMLNNEFAYSTRGTKAANKSYTFRALPKRVDILKEMGVDIVSLANNHALDYGVEALLDTFETLDSAKIEYVGAGNNFNRAKAAVYYKVGDMTIAYVAASRVIFSGDWYATNTRPGMIGTYDPTLFLEAIREARENSDFVVAYLHWGVERKHYPENYQKIMAKQYIDAGADAVIGCHPHVLQGLEFYKGKPIAYSLGNFWFSSYKNDSVLLKLYLEETGQIRMQLVPVKNENTYTSIIKNEQEKNNYFKFMEKISFGVSIDRDGFVIPSKID